MKQTFLRTKVNSQDFVIALIWVKNYLTFEGDTFKYEHLLEQAETYAMNGTALDTRIHSIDDFMVDAYKVYRNITAMKQKVYSAIDTIDISKDFKKTISIELDRFEKIFEDLIMNYKYEDAEIRGIQKGFLLEKMNYSVSTEDYENAATYRDLIKEC